MTSTKKKTMLLVVTIALVAILAVVGTLMLFTAKTDTAANVVTLNSAKIELQEKGGDIADWKTINKTDFKGIDFGDVVADSNVDKQSRINNTGKTPVYAAIKVALQAIDTDTGKQVKFPFGPLGYVKPNGGFDELVGAILPYSKNWRANAANEQYTGLPITIEDGRLFATLYYVEDADDPNTSLKVLDKETATSDLFGGTGITIPRELDMQSGKNIKFEIYLVGYAVQSENNAPASSSAADWKAVFGTLLD